MNRPYILCHMVTSIDGKVTGSFLSAPECAPSIDAYYRINRDLRGDAFACGRVTMEESFTGGWHPNLAPYANTTVPREDFAADRDARFFAVSFDRRGRLGWKTPRIQDDDPGYGDAHIVEVLCEDTPDANLAYLRSIGVSYIFAGKTELELSLALDKLRRLFGIRHLLLEGGSDINGVFLRQGVVDELSLVVAPAVAQESDKPLFASSLGQRFRLTETDTSIPGVLWLRYKNSQGSTA